MGEAARTRDERAHELEFVRLKSARSTAEFLPTYREGDDIEDFLLTFDWLATAHGYPEERWVTLLAGRLAEKAREEFARMEASKAVSYQEVKRAIQSAAI